MVLTPEDGGLTWMQLQSFVDRHGEIWYMGAVYLADPPK